MSMETGCSCDVGDDDGCNQVYQPRNVKASKQHRCCECGCVIEQGDVYEYVFGVNDDGQFTAKTCLTCCRIRDDYGCGFHGELRQEIWECLGLDYITGETCDD